LPTSKNTQKRKNDHADAYIKKILTGYIDLEEKRRGFSGSSKSHNQCGRGFQHLGS
jgi:hypothetical protein